MKDILLVLISDEVVFPLFEILFFAIFFYAVAVQIFIYKAKKGTKATLIRKGENWNDFHLIYGITTLVLLQMINSTEASTGYKTIISVSNLLMLTYLVFYNGWFRDKIVSFIIKTKEAPE